eukprot:scaffold26464_cov117-Cylindrotheca_fusiformis.AAC.1
MPKFGGFLKRTNNKKDKKTNKSKKEPSSVQFDEGSNTINQIPSVSSSEKANLWLSKNDLHKTRHDAAMEAKIEELVQRAARQDMGNFVTKKKLDQKVQEVIQGGPPVIREYLEQHLGENGKIGDMPPPGSNSSAAADEDKQTQAIRKGVRNRLITQQRDFTSSEDMDKKVDAIMALPPAEIMKFLGNESDSDSDDSESHEYSEESYHSSTSGDENDDSFSDSSPPASPRQPQLKRGMSKRKSQAVLTLEEAMESVHPVLKKQILDAMNDKNKGIDALEEALDEANGRYLGLKEKQRKFIAVQEELEALARRQMRQLEKMERQQQLPRAQQQQQQQQQQRNGDSSLKAEVAEIEALREALDSANDKTSKLKSKDRKLVAVGEELESLCRKQQVQLERSEKDHFDRLKAKDALNESLKDQLKDAKNTIKEKDQIINMLKQRNEETDDIDSESNGMIEEDIQDELVNNLEAKDKLIESLRNQVQEAKRMGREKDEEIKALERKLRESKRDGSNKSSRSTEIASADQQSVEQMQQKMKAIQEREEKNEELMEKMEEQLDEADEALQNAQAEQEDLQAKLDEANARIEELETNPASLSSANRGNQEQGKNKSNVAELEEQLRKSNERVEALRAKLNLANATIKDLQDEGKTPGQGMSHHDKALLNQKEEEVNLLKGKLSTAEEMISTLQNREPNNDVEIRKKEMDEKILALEQEIEQLASGGDKARSGNDQQSLIDQLEEKDRRIASLEDDLKYANGLVERFESVRGVPDDVAVSRKLREKESEIKELRQELMEAKSGGSESVRKSIILRQQKADDLLLKMEEQLEETEAALEAKEKELNELKAKVLEGEHGRNRGTEPGDDSIEQIAKLQEQVSSLERDLRSTVKDRDRKWVEKDGQIETLEQELAEARSQAELLGAKLERGPLSGDEKDGEIERLEKEVSDLQRDLRCTVKDRDKKWLEKDNRIEELEEALAATKSQSDSNAGGEGEGEREANELLIQKLVKQLKSTEAVLDEQYEQVNENEALIRSLQRELEKQKKTSDMLSVGTDPSALDNAALRVGLEKTETARREAQEQLDKELKANKEMEMKVMKLEHDLEEKEEEIVLKEKQLELSSVLEDQNKQLKRSLDSTRRELEDKENQISSMKKTHNEREASGVISKGGLDHILEAANLNAKVEDLEKQLRKEEVAHKRARRKIQNMEKNKRKSMPSDGKYKSDVQRELEHQTKMTESLRNQLETANISIDTKSKIIESLAEELGDKDRLLRNLEKKLDALEDGDPLDRQKEEELIRRLEKEHASKEKAKRKYEKLQSEMEEQMKDWADLEQEMDDTRARMNDLESQVAREVSQRSRGGIAQDNKEGDDFNLYLDGLTRKVRNARSQLEAAHGKLDKTVGRYRATPLKQ